MTKFHTKKAKYKKQQQNNKENMKKNKIRNITLVSKQHNNESIKHNKFKIKNKQNKKKPLFL